MANLTGASRPGPGRTAAAADAERAAAEGEALATRLAEIAGSATLAVDALDPALRAILEATGAGSGAICLFDQRHELLRLAAEAGLSDDGCRRLRIVRRGDVAGWDMPLHGLLNRRAYLIESAAQNRYVPPLVASTVPVRAVACLPLYAGTNPVGSLVLVALMPKTLGERDIRVLDRPLRELGRLIETVRRQAADPQGPAVEGRAAEPLPPPRAAARPSGDDAAGADASRVRSLASALAAAQREQARLETEIQRLRAGAPRDEERSAEQVAEIDRLRAKLAEAEAGAAHEHRVREELEAALARGASSGQQEVRQAVETARRAEAARAAIVAENDRLAAEVERLRAGGPYADGQSAELVVEVDRLRARLAEAEAGAAHAHRMREELEAALERGASSGQHELRGALDAASRAEAARAALAAENERLIAALDRLRSGVPREEAHAAELALEMDRLRARLAEAEAGAAHAQRAREELEVALERGVSHGQDDVRRAHEAAKRADDERAAVATENARLLAELEWARHEVERIEPLAVAVRTAEDEQARLRAALEATDGERAEVERSAAHRAAEQAAEVDRLGRRLADAEASAARERALRESLESASAHADSGEDVVRALEATRAAEEARDGALAELADARAELTRARGAADEVREVTERMRADLGRAHDERRAAVSERDGLAAAIEQARLEGGELSRRLEERERQLERLEADRTAFAARFDSLTKDSDALRAAFAAVEMERDRATAEVEGAAAARARLEESLAHALEEARAREQALAARVEERDTAVERLERERAADTAAATARVDAATVEGERLRAAVTSLEAERDRLAAEAEGAAAARARLETALAEEIEAARTREQAVAARLEEREREFERVGAERAAEIADAAARIDGLLAESEQRAAAVAALEAERDRLAAEAEGAAAARLRFEEELARGREEARGREQALTARLAEHEEEMTRLREERAAEVAAQTAAALDGVEPEPVSDEEPPAVTAEEPPPPRVEAAATPEATPTAAAAAPVSNGTIAVLDVDRGWERLSRDGRQVVVVTPDDRAPGRMADVAPEQLVVNLAAPRVLDTLLALRASGCKTRVSGCIADASAGRALALDLVEAAARPLDPDAVIAAFGRYAAKGTRVVTIGDDVDAFVSLRQALARDGMSVSMAWNAKQAADLIPMVRPAVVVIDLDMPAGEGFGIVARLAAAEKVPVAIVVAGSKDAGRGFAGTLTDPAMRQSTVPIAEVMTRALRSRPGA